MWFTFLNRDRFMENKDHNCYLVGEIKMHVDPQSQISLLLFYFYMGVLALVCLAKC